MARHQEHRQLWLGILLLTAAQLRGPAEAVSAAAAGPPAAGQTAGGQNTTQAAEEGGTKPELPAETGQSPPRGTVSGVSAQQAAALKPAFHITGAHGWINDPNGMFQRNGTFHIFYQWNPVLPAVWGAPYWGHITSTDLVHWQRLPPALAPDTEYDSDGCFSGSTTLVDGVPVMLYTGVSNFSELGYYKQVQAMARPADLSDPQLKLWIKYAANPVISQAPPLGSSAQFRDPTTAWKQGGLWYTAVGAMQACEGSAALYSSPDFHSWAAVGDWATQATLGQLNNAQCVPPALPQPGIGSCDQFGSHCRMWECPDVFEVSNGTWALKWSDQSKRRDPFSRDWYVLGSQIAIMGNRSVGPALSTGGNSTAAPAAFVASMPPVQQVVDFGSVYASKSFPTEDGRRVMLGWVFETAAGCVEQCSLGTNFTSSLGWQGAHTLPREITFDAASNTLLMNPVHEAAALRAGLLANATGLSLPSNATTAGLLDLNMTASTSRGRQLEVLLSFAVDSGVPLNNATAVSFLADPQPAVNTSISPFTVGVQLDTGGGTYTRVHVNGTAAAAPDGSMTITQAGVFVDRMRSGGHTNGSTEGGPMPLPPAGLQTTSIMLQVFVDHSIIEAYALEGRGRVTSRIYPEGVDNDWALAVFGKSAASFFSADAAVYELGPAFAASEDDDCC